jgi:hypothetical protein
MPRNFEKIVRSTLLIHVCMKMLVTQYIYQIIVGRATWKRTLRHSNLVSENNKAKP